MNRAEKRAKVKELQKSGLKKDAAKRYVEANFDNIELEEGVKVKLNYELMRRHPDWKIQREDFKEWVINHKEDIFTVEWDRNRKANNTKDRKIMVCLKEDDTNPKWLFHTATLIAIPQAKVTLNNGEKINIDLSNVADNYQDIMEAVQKGIKDI